MAARRLGLLVALLALLVPTAQATVDLTASISFDARDRYTLELEATHRGDHAIDHRAAADRDRDGTVSGQEASRQKAELQATLEDPGATSHRLDGHRPDHIEVEQVWTDGLIGEVEQADPVRLVLTASYTYTLNTTGPVVFQVQRDPPPDHRNETVVVEAPSRHRISDLWNLSGPGGSPEVTDQTDGRRTGLTGVPTGAWGLTLVPRDPRPAAVEPSDGANGTEAPNASAPENGSQGAGEPLHRVQPPDQAPGAGVVAVLLSVSLAARSLGRGS